jgi:hypothetical protein
MGFRFRKSINLGAGFKANLSKSGVGFSWGTKGVRLTRTAKGKNRATVSIPGTGISYSKEFGGKKNTKKKNPEQQNPQDHVILKAVQSFRLIPPSESGSVILMQFLQFELTPTAARYISAHAWVSAA